MSDINPLLAKVKLPGQIFQLPSRGIFYKDGELEPSVQNGEVHVHPMSALAEIHMKNPDQLFSGQAVETVFKECVSGIAKPSHLLSKDVDALMIFLRTVTYGDSYEFVAKHTCENAKDHSYVASIGQMISTMQMIDPTTVDELFTVKMPNDQVVKIQPTRYIHVVDLLKSNVGKEKLTVEDQKANLVSMLSAVVVQVDDITNPEHITEWLRTVPPPFVNRIANALDKVNEWGPSLRWSGQCKDCGEELKVELPINPVTFFTE